ncbi:Lrp/AsnC family transcriptional regulator [Candidatus Poribacteria bacterium]
MKLGKRELAIISHLRQDGRITLKAIGRKVNAPISTVFERLKLFKKSGLIRPTVLLDFTELGFASRILVAIKIDREIREEVENYLVTHPNVNTVQHVNNGFSLMFEALFIDMRASEYFIEDLDHQFKLRKKMVFYILGESKREAFLSDPATIDMVTRKESSALSSPL